MIDTLASYQVDSVRGFLPAEDPLECLPPGFEVWERIAAELSRLLVASKLRSVLKKLPPLDISNLEEERQLRRAMLLLSIFANGYVWGGKKPATIIPRGVGLPLWQIAEKLGRPPILSHASVVLDNWKRLDKTKPVELDNIATLQLFLGGLDEQWFYLATVAMEAKGALALGSFVEAQKAIAANQIEVFAEQLLKIASVIVDMQAALLRILEKCDPYIFYHRVRPFLGGWPEPGIVYEGVSDIPQKYAGGSAAQSSLVQSLDAALGIKHQEETQFFLQAMRSYMPPLHRKFIETLESELSIKEFVLNHKHSYPILCDLYNNCVQELDQFRKKHRSIAVNYIFQQDPQQARGTGGTNFVHFLKKVEKDTKANLIG
ncbi:MAG: indoleamine 2,3-dioxygenase [Xenococcaceae cyanobacterium]